MNGFGEYDIPDKTGRYVYAGGYFGWILLDKPVTEPGINIESMEEKAKAYDQILVFAGKGICDDKGRYTWTRQYAKDCREEDSYSRSVIKIEKDGSNGDPGSARE